MMPCRVISHSSFYSKENPDPSFYYQHPPPSPHHTAASEHRDRQQIGRASHHQNLRPLLACAIDIPPQCSLACRSHCLMNVGVSPAWLLRLMRSSEFQRGTALYPTHDDGNLSSQRSGTNNATCPSAADSRWNSCGQAGTRWRGSTSHQVLQASS
ncbi:hypothetical protein GGI42DRAFT_342038 [Trichoderma sp. SZMC 28013]